MKKRIITAALMALGTLASTAPARAADNGGWYAGLRLGHGVERLGNGEVDGALANQGVMGGSSLDSGATTWGLFGGYQFNRNFAVEGGYDDLGRFGFSSAVSAPAADTVSGHYEAQALDLSAVGMLPFARDWSAFGKAGFAYSQAKLDAGSASGAVAVNGQDHWGLAPLLGAGINWDLTREVALRAEWDRYLHVGDSNTGRGDIDQYTVGVAYHF